MTSKSQTSFFFIKSQKQNNNKKYNNHSFKKNYLKKKTKFPEEVVLPESSSENLKGHPEEHFFWKIFERGVPGDFRKKYSSGRRLVSFGRTLFSECFRNSSFRNFWKNP